MSRPAGDGDTGAQRRSRSGRQIAPVAGVRGTAHRTVQITHPESGVEAVAWDAAGLFLAVDDLDRTGARGGQSLGRGQTGRTRADHQHIDRAPPPAGAGDGGHGVPVCCRAHGPTSGRRDGSPPDVPDVLNVSGASGASRARTVAPQ